MLIFVTGGSGSGKSEYAENLAVELKQKAECENCNKPRSENGRKAQGIFCSQKDMQTAIQVPELVYIATMEPVDAESRKRVERHRRMRAHKQFETRECYTHLEELSIKKNEILLLECLSNLVANEMFSPEGRKVRTAEVIEKGICFLEEKSCHLVIVGNNVFEDGVEYDETTEEYLRQMAEIHRFLGRRADQVVEVICGIPVVWKDIRQTGNEGTRGRV